MFSILFITICNAMDIDMAALKSSDTLSNENIIFWLKKAEEWGSMKKLSNMQIQVIASITRDMLRSRSTGYLGTFLSSVHGRLRADSISQVLKSHPKLGHLLGRLCSCQHLIAGNCEVYSKLFSCVQALRAQQPQDGMEKKAKDWAESQIRHTASYYHQKNPASEIAESLGYTALEYNVMSSDKLIESIERDLDHLITEQRHYIRGIQAENVSLEELSDMCLPLVGRSPSSMGLVDRVLVLHPKDADDQLSHLFLERVTRTQACAYDPAWKTEFCLTREARTSLWLQYLPALEQEILLLVQAFSQYAPDLATYDALKIMHSRDLSRACTEHKILYKAVDSCIQQVLWRTNGSHSVIRFVHLFQVAVNEAIQELNSSQYSVHRLFPQRLRPVVNLLALDPRDLPQEAHGIHLTSIQVTLKATIDDPVVSNNPHEMYAVWMTLVKFLQWYHAAVYALIRGNGGGDERCRTLDASLGLVMWFHHPLSFGDHSSNVKDDLYHLIRGLHSCIMGEEFQGRDLERLLSNLGRLPSVTGKDLPLELITHLAMSAILQATSISKDDVLEILDMMLSKGLSPSNISKLALLQSHLDIHQIFVVSGVGSKEACPVHVTEAIRILQNNT